jgi:hypothetical protein
MTRQRGKTISQKVALEAAKEALERGENPEQAQDNAVSEAGLSRLSPAMRSELGLDEEETRAAFGKIAVDQFGKSLNGEFPAWLGDDPKLKLEYLKTFKGTLETALVTKTERRIVENDDTRHRSDEDIKFKLKYGRWPEEMVVNGDEPGAVN